MSDRPNTWKRIARDGTLKRTLLLRADALRRIREWFWARGFIEIDPPILAPWVGMEPHLVPLHAFVSDGRGQTLRLFHQTSPEYALKKLLAAGMPDCFALGHVFRDGEVSALHQPEFTLLEWYRREAGYAALMRDTEELVAELATALCGAPRATYAGNTTDLTPPWKRVTVAEAMHRWAGVDIERHTDAESFRIHARERGYAWVSDESWEELFFKLFLTYVEPKLGIQKPVFLHEYPLRFSALARRCPDRPGVVERFEAYIAGVELCNGFGELTDPAEQRERFRAERQERVRMGREPLTIDEDLLDALAELPPCAGNALGVDRLVMLLTGQTEISRVVWFPYEVMAQWAKRYGETPSDEE